MDTREKTLASAHTLVVKVGSAVLTTADGLHLSVLYNLVEQLARLARQGRRICLVSSGAVAAGRTALPGRGQTVEGVSGKQALAAIGQGCLMREYEHAFAAQGLLCAQVLLTRDDLRSRTRFLNARNTFMNLLDWGVDLSLPIRRREVIHEPMLEEIQILPYLKSGEIARVTCGGESGKGARLCRYDWILSTRRQCMECGVAFSFHQTGAWFEKDGRTYQIPRSQQLRQAEKAALEYRPSMLPDSEKQREELFLRLSKSSFRSRFSLSPSMKQYVLEKGEEVIQRHAQDFVGTRLAPAQPEHDGKQTPMKGHPVFLAQHATGTCCRGCLEKWYQIPQGRPLTEWEQDRIVDILMDWIHRKMKLFLNHPESAFF